MCCGLAILAFFGPRILGALWWLFRPIYFTSGFSSILWPILGLVFLPWTTITYVAVYPGGLTGFEWLIIVFGVVLDVASYGSSGYGYYNRGASV